MSANHDLFRRISAGAINGNGSLPAGFSGASTDGSRVFFVTTESLAGGDSDSTADIYQRFNGTTTRVSVGAVNGNFNFPATFNKASNDGSRVFFSTFESLVNADFDGQPDIYQRFNGNTTWISAGAVNGNGAFPASFNGISNDGTKVFFTTQEHLVAGDTDNALDVYERSGGTTKRVSVGAQNGNGALPAQFVGASGNGNRVFFVSPEQLVAGDTDAQMDVYERSNGTTKRVSVGAQNGNGAFPSNFSRVSSDGTRVIFGTAEQLVAGDLDAQIDIYMRSGTTTTRLSGGAQNGNGALPAQFVGASADATRVFFVTAEKLVAGDTDTQQDIYQWSGGTTTRISAGAINGNGALASSFNGASADGTKVWFATAEQLVNDDSDGVLDLYQRSGGTTTLVSDGEINGNLPVGANYVGASPDGSHVFFMTLEQLTTADGDTSGDIYERSGGKTYLLTPGNGVFTPAYRFSSTDGSRVFYETMERVLVNDTDTFTDVYGAYDAP